MKTLEEFKKNWKLGNYTAYENCELLIDEEQLFDDFEEILKAHKEEVRNKDMTKIWGSYKVLESKFIPKGVCIMGTGEQPNLNYTIGQTIPKGN